MRRASIATELLSRLGTAAALLARFSAWSPAGGRLQRRRWVTAIIRGRSSSRSGAGQPSFGRGASPVRGARLPPFGGARAARPRQFPVSRRGVSSPAASSALMSPAFATSSTTLVSVASASFASFADAA